MGLLDLLNPFTWRADLRGERELEMAEKREAAQREALLGARYGGEPRVHRPSTSIAVGPIENPSVRTTWGQKSIEHRFILNCVGPAPAQDVYVWLAYGLELDTRRTDEKHLGLLGVGQERSFGFVETKFAGGCVPREGALMCRWTDGNGEHTKSLLDVTVHI